MYDNDWLSLQIKVISKTLSVLLFGKDTASSIVTEDAEDTEGLTVSDEKLLGLTLKKYVSNGEISKVEDILFESIKNNPSDRNLEVAISFYNELENLGDHFLEEHNFSMQEVLQGLNDIKNIYESL